MNKRFSKEHLVPMTYLMLLILFTLCFIAFCMNFPAVMSAVNTVLSAAKSVIYGVIISLVLLPIVRLYEKLAKKLFCKKRERKSLVRTLGIAGAELSFVTVVVIMVLLMIPLLSENFSVFRDNLSSYIYYAQNWVETHIIIFEWMEPFYDAIIIGIQDSIFKFSLALNNLIPQLITIVSNIFSEVWSFIIGFIISIYLLSARVMLFSLFNKISAAITPRKFRRGVFEFVTLIYTNFTEFFSSRIIDSLIVGVLFYFICWIIGIPFYALIALMVFVTNLIPVFGPIVGTITGTLVVLLVKPEFAMYYFFIAIAINIFDRIFIEPRLMSKRLRQNVGLELVLLILAYACWGIIGIFVAIPLYITLRALFITFLEYRLHRKSLPVDPYDYINAYGEEECILEEARMDEESISRYRAERAAKKVRNEAKDK